MQLIGAFHRGKRDRKVLDREAGRIEAPCSLWVILLVDCSEDHLGSAAEHAGWLCVFVVARDPETMKRPHVEDDASIDCISRNRAERAAVMGHAAIVAHDEVLIVAEMNRLERLSRDVVCGIPVNVDASVSASDGVSRNLEVRVVTRWDDLAADRPPRVKHHDFAPMRVSEQVGEPLHQHLTIAGW